MTDGRVGITLTGSDVYSDELIRDRLIPAIDDAFRPLPRNLIAMNDQPEERTRTDVAIDIALGMFLLLDIGWKRDEIIEQARTMKAEGKTGEEVSAHLQQLADQRLDQLNAVEGPEG